MGGVGCQFDQFFDGTLGTAGGTGLDDNGDQQEEGNDARSLEVGTCQSREDGEGDQFVHVDLAVDKVLHHSNDDGESKDECAEKGAQTGGELPFTGEDPFQHKRVQRKQTADEGENDAPKTPAIREIWHGLEAKHTKFHTYGKDVIDAIMRNDFSKARSLYEEADRYSDELIGDLKKMKAIAESN